MQATASFLVSHLVHAEALKCSPGSPPQSFVYDFEESLGHNFCSVRTAAPQGTFWHKSQKRDELLTVLSQKSPKIVVTTPQHRDLCVSYDVIAIIVESPREALLMVAKAWRAQFMMPIVGITGTVGKTSTKQMLRAIFSRDAVPVYIAPDGPHSLTRMACNILAMNAQHIAGIFEIGITNVAAMDDFVAVLRPTMGVITTISHDYLKGLHSLETIAAENRKLFAHLTPSQIGFICGDQPLLTEQAYEHPVVRFGLKNKNTVGARRIKVMHDQNGALRTKFLLRLYEQEREVSIPGNHVGVVYAALAASAVSYFLHVPGEVITEGLAAYIPAPGRFEPHILPDSAGLILNDTHTANPESVRAALQAVDQMELNGCTTQKIAVLGDMVNLGEKESFWHRQVGRHLEKTKTIRDIVLVGNRARYIQTTAPIMTTVTHAHDWQQAHEIVTDKIKQAPSIVLVNASQSMHLDQLVHALV